MKSKNGKSMPSIPKPIGDLEINEDKNNIDCKGYVLNFSPNGKGYLKIKGCKFINCFSKKNVVVKNVNFYGCEFVECNFNGVIFEECEFHDCKIKNCIFYKSNFRNVYIDPDSFVFNWHWYWYWANVNAWLFKNLYRNYKNLHQDDFARESDKKFNFYKRYEYLNGKKKRYFKFFSSFLYDLLCGYGYGVLNVCFFTLCLIGIYAWVIENYLRSNIGGKHEDIGAIHSLYYSIISFSSIGYGDITVNHEFYPLLIVIAFSFVSLVWCAVASAIVVKRVVK